MRGPEVRLAVYPELGQCRSMKEGNERLLLLRNALRLTLWLTFWNCDLHFVCDDSKNEKAHLIWDVKPGLI